jgi:hypothetical protein
MTIALLIVHHAHDIVIGLVVSISPTFLLGSRLISSSRRTVFTDNLMILFPSSWLINIMRTHMQPHTIPNDPNTSAAIEQAHLKNQEHRPIGELAKRTLNVATDFDMTADSQAQGTAMAMLIAHESEPFRSTMIGVLHTWAGSDPKHDPAVLGMIRAGSRSIRKFLDSDAVAREFARRVGQCGLLVLAEMTQKNRN